MPWFCAHRTMVKKHAAGELAEPVSWQLCGSPTRSAPARPGPKPCSGNPHASSRPCTSTSTDQAMQHEQGCPCNLALRSVCKCMQARIKPVMCSTADLEHSKQPHQMKFVGSHILCAARTAFSAPSAPLQHPARIRGSPAAQLQHRHSHHPGSGRKPGQAVWRHPRPRPASQLHQLHSQPGGTAHCGPEQLPGSFWTE